MPKYRKNTGKVNTIKIDIDTILLRRVESKDRGGMNFEIKEKKLCLSSVFFILSYNTLFNEKSKLKNSLYI